MSRVPMLDLARRTAALEPDLSEAVAAVLRRGVFLLGPETEAFEAELRAIVRLSFFDLAGVSGDDATAHYWDGGAGVNASWWPPVPTFLSGS